MKRLFGIVAALVFSASAFAADLPVKTPAVSWLPNGYPYQSSGPIFGIYVEGGASSVNGATVPGVNANSLTTTQANIGATFGWAWGSKTSSFAYTIEQDVGFTNFNGSAAGLNISGPLETETRLTAWTPFANILALLPGWANWTVPPFAPLPSGTVASNLQSGLFVGAHGNDISLNFPGLVSNREWRFSPVIGVAAMEQLSNGTALRAFAKVVMQDKGLTIGPIGKQATGGLGPQYMVGTSVIW
jgi:hypothetical protein